MPIQPTPIVLIESPSNLALLPSSLQSVGTAVEASRGTVGTPSDTNRFVTDLDTRVPIFDMTLKVFLISDRFSII